MITKFETALLRAIEANNVMPLSKLKPYIWHDEINDLFLLTKYCEIYLYTGYKSETVQGATLRLLSWSRKNTSQLKKRGIISREWSTDDHLDILDTKIENLPQILALGSFKKRPNLNGKWIKSREELLAHKILPYDLSIINQQRKVQATIENG